MDATQVFRSLHILCAALWAGAGLYRTFVASNTDRVRHATYMTAMGGATILFGFGILGTARERYTPEALGDGFMPFSMAMGLAMLAWILAATHFFLVRRSSDRDGRRRAKMVDHASLGCILLALLLLLSFRY